MGYELHRFTWTVANKQTFKDACRRRPPNLPLESAESVLVGKTAMLASPGGLYDTPNTEHDGGISDASQFFKYMKRNLEDYV